MGDALYRAAALLASLLLAAAAATGTERLAGVARVVDADTLDVGSQRVRLIGIDAPEGAQLCRLDGRPWRCGDDAEAALRALAEGRRVECDVLGRDRWGRALAVCRADGVDLAREMVPAGWALARYPARDAVVGPDYGREQVEARNGRRGLWGGQFTMPWDWRRGR